MMPSSTVADATLIDELRGAVHTLTGAIDQYDPLLDLVGNAHFVLLGEASHGTHDFYRERIQITKRLILEKGFTAVACTRSSRSCATRRSSTNSWSDGSWTRFRRAPNWRRTTSPTSPSATDCGGLPCRR